MSTSQDGKTVEDRVVRRKDREAYLRFLGLQGPRKTWPNEDQERRKSDLTKLKKWTASGRINGLKMEVSKFRDVETLSVSNDAVLAFLSNSSTPYLILSLLPKLSVDYLHRLETHLDKQFIKEWLNFIDSADQQNGTKWSLVTNSDRRKRLKARVPTALSGHAHLGLDKSEWALTSFLSYIIFFWRPICGVDPTPLRRGKDVCLEDIASAFEKNDQVRAAIRAILDKKDWRPAIKVGIKLIQQMDIGPTWPSLESKDSSEGHTRCYRLPTGA
ncbi:uncharacterized protein PHALS_09139 [Plasmopara halstedii]|uniref:Uncharacterized protein n=1 Tax=Plasmopara halstedii TaxID=4781 RepID=A0A0P1AEB2_PLAHL|nr:uncharacterized protein PHALS_09139 [Plasmopara halstedii]CEG39077.1 hypothetical protein PHALS_09139 [Plasmopara halstedii]|eukprot:XP_024575446.1 hypothetical protein PHALS_09139 [Plasmopara halstedii]